MTLLKINNSPKKNNNKHKNHQREDEYDMASSNLKKLKKVKS